MLQREELESAQTSLYIKKKISRHKSHFQRKPKPKIVATLNFISRAWGMLYPSMWLPRKQDSFILCYSIISWKLLPYITPMIFKSTLNGKFPQKADFKLQFRNLCQENVIENQSSYNISCCSDILTFFYLDRRFSYP